MNGINIRGEIELSISDVIGNIVMHEYVYKTSGIINKEYNFKDLNKGVYLIKISYKNLRFIKKLMII